MMGWVGSVQYRDAVSRGLRREYSVCFVTRYGGRPRMFGCGGRVNNVWISWYRLFTLQFVLKAHRRPGSLAVSTSATVSCSHARSVSEESGSTAGICAADKPQKFRRTTRERVEASQSLPHSTSDSRSPCKGPLATREMTTRQPLNGRERYSPAKSYLGSAVIEARIFKTRL